MVPLMPYLLDRLYSLLLAMNDSPPSQTAAILGYSIASRYESLSHLRLFTVYILSWRVERVTRPYLSFQVLPATCCMHHGLRERLEYIGLRKSLHRETVKKTSSLLDNAFQMQPIGGGASTTL